MPNSAALLPYLGRMDENRWYTNFGPLLAEFESRLRDRFAPGVHVATVSSGTIGLALGLKALGAKPGGLCALPAWTFVATAHAAIEAGLTPWFVDVDPENWMLDPAQVRAALPKAPGPVSAVIPVAAFGHVPDLKAWAAFQATSGIPVLLDAAAAFDDLAEAPVPAMVSLHATKVLGIGEGGFVAALDRAFIERFRELTSFGFRGSRVAHVPATNAKLSEYAAAVGHASLDNWPTVRLRYLRTAQLLRIAMTDVPGVRFQPGWGLEWATSVCVVRLPDGSAARVEQGLEALGVSTRRWWGLGCHRDPAFAGCPAAALPATERLSASTLGLPFWPDMEASEIERVAQALRTALKDG